MGLLRLLCFMAVSGSGESVLYFRVVDGSMAMVLLSVLLHTCAFFRELGGLLVDLVDFIMIGPSSESLLSAGPDTDRELRELEPAEISLSNREE